MPGEFDRSWMERRDADGVTLADAMRSAGLDPAKAGSHGMDRRSLAGYFELHIEQGPVLLHSGLPLGIVTSISGGNRHAFTVRGEAGHAGTVPMAMRHDALAAASESGMMFVRCGAGGVSHNPAETVAAEDAAIAQRAVLEFMRRFAAGEKR